MSRGNTTSFMIQSTTIDRTCCVYRIRWLNRGVFQVYLHSASKLLREVYLRPNKHFQAPAGSTMFTLHSSATSYCNLTSTTVHAFCTARPTRTAELQNPYKVLKGTLFLIFLTSPIGLKQTSTSYWIWCNTFHFHGFEDPF